MSTGVNHKFICLAGAALLGCTAATLSTPAYAGNETMMQLIEVLKDNGTIDQKAYDALRAAAMDEQKAAVEVTDASKMPKIDTKGKLQISSPDGDFKFRIGGRVQADAAFYDNDEGTWKNSDLNNSTEIRRSRIYLRGTMWKYWDYKFQWEFAGNKVAAKDQFISYKGFKPAKITLGNFKEPQGLSLLTSSNVATFMERALPIETFEPGRNMGIALQSYGELGGMWTGALGFFGESVNFSNEDGDEGWGFPFRITYAPIHEKTQVLHFGTSFEYRTPGDDNEVRYNTRPESHIANNQFVDTQTISDVDNTLLYDVEMLGIYGPFSLQGEYLWKTVSRNAGSDLDFSGGYIMGSWFITGESKKYSVKNASLGQIKPNSTLMDGGLGAWELAARYSYIDLEEDDILGGDQSDLTIGLNWYPNSNVRFMFNYVKVLDVSSDKEDSFDNVSPDIFQFRGQLNF